MFLKPVYLEYTIIECTREPHELFSRKIQLRSTVLERGHCFCYIEITYDKSPGKQIFLADGRQYNRYCSCYNKKNFGSSYVLKVLPSKMKQNITTARGYSTQGLP